MLWTHPVFADEYNDIQEGIVDNVRLKSKIKGAFGFGSQFEYYMKVFYRYIRKEKKRVNIL
jgi:hypothetical protein